MKGYYVYILTNRSKTLHTGITGDLSGRVYQHKSGTGSKFTSNYKINHLVYYEEFSDVEDAIAREKQIKGWIRAKKIDLIETKNPNWNDLSSDWYED
jgi:putative endonuclease